MKRGYIYSKRIVSAGAGAVGAAFAMYLLRLNLGATMLERRNQASNLESKISREIAARSKYDRINLDALRAEVGRFRNQLGGDGAWENLVRRLGRRWTADTESKDEREGYSIVLATFRMQTSDISDWPEIVAAVGDAESVPGVSVVEFEMKASGSPEHRSLDLVRVLVAVRTRRKETRPIAP